MAIKIKIPKNGGQAAQKWRGLPRDPVIRAALIVFLVVAIGVCGFFSYFYIKYDRIIQQRFRSPVFSNSAKIYALPRTLHDGDKLDAKEIAVFLRRAGYSDKDSQSPLGSFHLVSDGIEVTPGPESYHSPESAHIAIHDGQVERITSKGNELSAYELEPQLVTALFDYEQRSKRQVVKYADFREERFHGSFTGNIEDVTFYPGWQSINGLIHFGLAAGGHDDRCAFACRGLGGGKSES